MIKNENGLKDPRDRRGLPERFNNEMQEAPGVQSEMKPVPDSGEECYVGNGRLKGRKAFITGGDSGIGRAIAIAYAREGADVAINYLLDESNDADSLVKLLAEEAKKRVSSKRSYPFSTDQSEWLYLCPAARKCNQFAGRNITFLLSMQKSWSTFPYHRLPKH